MKETIFVVDDSIMNLVVAENGLSSHYNVVKLISGEKMFEALRHTIPALILLDLTMPGMDGFEALGMLKRNPDYAGIPVIIITGIDDEKVGVKGFEMGAVDFVNKPFSVSILLNRINTHIGIDKLIKKRTMQIEQMHRNLLYILADVVESRDTNTGGHITRTAKYLEVLIGGMKELGVYVNEIRDWDIDRVTICSALHDVGKISVPDQILNKPGKLTPEEFEIMKEHATAGKNIIRRVIDVAGEERHLLDACLFAEFHHENWDGSGYPHGLKGTAIPLHGRMMAIADVYDALVSERPYKKPFTDEEAVTIIMEEAGRKFDPKLASVFYSIRNKFRQAHEDCESHQVKGSIL